MLSTFRPALLSSLAALALVGLGLAAPTSAAATSKTTFVAPNGSDRAAGTISAPLQTVQEAVKRLHGGGTVDVRGGRYYQKVDLTGATGVTIEAYRHEHVILDGSRFKPADGRSAMVNIAGSSHVTLSGLEITDYRSSELDAMPIGIYVHGADDHIRISGNHVHDLGNDNQTLGSFDINAHGIAVYGDNASHSISDLTISKNTVDHLSLGASESVVVNGNVDGWSISGNDIHDNNNIGIDAIGYEPTLSGKYRYTDLNRARNGVISDNTVSYIRSQGNPAYYEDGVWCNCADGIYVDGATHIAIRNNVVTGNDIGIEVAAENARGSADHVDVRSNTINNSLYVGIATGGYCDGASDCGDVKTGQSHDNQFVGNTLRNNNKLNDGSPEVLIQFYAYDNVFENNTITATNDAGALLGTVERADADKVSGHNVSDKNTFAVSGTSDVSFGWLGKTYSSFKAYQKATGQDLHSTLSGVKTGS
nr:right-handed parallel beta-helix repeat-containing protein [Humibacter sp. RRB41]